MGREIRRVPANWQHPRDEEGHYKPLMDDYVGSLKYYKEDVEQFIECMTEVIKKGEVIIYNETYKTPQEVYEYLTEDEITPPNLEDYMPGGDWYQLYEDVSEGTPLSPAFEKPEELVDWLTNNKDFWGTQWSREGAEDMVKTGFRLSWVMKNGVMYKPEEQHLIK